jgi:hypothetical protein
MIASFSLLNIRNDVIFNLSFVVAKILSKILWHPAILRGSLNQREKINQSWNPREQSSFMKRKLHKAFLETQLLPYLSIMILK